MSTYIIEDKPTNFYYNERTEQWEENLPETMADLIPRAYLPLYENYLANGMAELQAAKEVLQRIADAHSVD